MGWCTKRASNIQFTSDTSTSDHGRTLRWRRALHWYVTMAFNRYFVFMGAISFDFSWTLIRVNSSSNIVIFVWKMREIREGVAATICRRKCAENKGRIAPQLPPAQQRRLEAIRLKAEAPWAFTETAERVGQSLQSQRWNR